MNYRPWRTAYRRAWRLADSTIERFDQIIRDAIDKTDGDYAPSEATEAFAEELADKDRWLFEMLLDSSAARKIYERTDAEINRHPEHPTAH